MHRPQGSRQCLFGPRLELGFVPSCEQQSSDDERQAEDDERNSERPVTRSTALPKA